MEKIISTTWWDDDDDDDDMTIHKTLPKPIHKSLLLPWWKSKRQQPEGSTSHTNNNSNNVEKSNEESVPSVYINLQQQQQHPLRTDLYEIHCQWRGIAKQQQQPLCNRQKRKGCRALWTSRLAAVKDNNDDDFNSDNVSLSSSLSNPYTIGSTSRKRFPLNNHQNDDDLQSRTTTTMTTTTTIYDHRAFQLEFNPNGYVRLRWLYPPLLQNSGNNNKSNSGDRYSNDDSNNNNDMNHFIGTWKLQPNGLVIHIPLPMMMKKKKQEGLLQGQDHIMEMDFHMNPFGTHPKFTRGIIYLPTDSIYGNPFLKLLRIRPIVGTFTGKGIGIDTVDLSYQQRM